MVWKVVASWGYAIGFFFYKEFYYVCLSANDYAPKCICGGIHVGSWLVICEGRI
jgi:hypothetical protein